MVNTKMFVFKHPKYYKELRKRNKSDQVISNAEATAASERAPGQGQSDSQVVNQVKLSSQSQATSYKLPGPRPISNANKGLIHKHQAPSVKLSNQPVQASSDKHQAPSSKLQASSLKQQAPRS
jgi:hypothetical protein